MRDQFLDQLGGVHVLPESSKDVGRTKVSIDERVAGRHIDKHGERAVEDRPDAEGPRRSGAARSSAWPWVVGTAVIALAALFWVGFSHREGGQAASAQMPPTQVTVSKPLVRDVDAWIGFLGQFSAVDSVELRAQVGGTLTAIEFQDGQIVHKGDPLFVIDPRPYQIRLDQAVAQLQTAQAQGGAGRGGTLAGAAAQADRFRHGGDRRPARRRPAQRAGRHRDRQGGRSRTPSSTWNIRRVTAPFTGRIGAHLVSVGSLVSGSRGGTSPTTLLATIVSLDPIYLDFDMSESDYLAYAAGHHGAAPHDDVAISLDGDGHFDRHGTLDFIDNAVNRSSGTIHARATVPNPDLTITPGQFARLRVALGHPAPVLLVPAAAVVPDQSRQIVMTVARGWHGRSEAGRDRRALRRAAGHPQRPRARTTASSSTVWCAPARDQGHAGQPARSRPTPPAARRIGRARCASRTASSIAPSWRR